jgi:hypothetical protein
MKETQIAQVRKHLLQYGKITPMEALAYYNCYRLASVIHRLRNDGMDITTILHEDKGYATYWLNR